MEKYLLIKKENNYLIVNAENYNQEFETVMSSNNILDLIQQDDLIEVTKPDFDNGDKNIVVNYIPIIAKYILDDWLKSGLNIIAIYKKDSNKNFIRIAEKINKEWRIL